MQARFLLVIAACVFQALSVACAAAPPAPAPPAAPAAKAAAVDADVRQVYESFVKVEMPGVPIELLQAAKAEGTVTYYHQVTPSFPKLIAAFNERVPFVKAQGFQLTAAALMEKFRAEETAGTHIADVWNNSGGPAADEIVKLGFAMEYTLTSADKYPAPAHDPGRWYPPGLNPWVSAWNTKVVSDADAKRILATWQGLGDPSWGAKTTTGYVDYAAGGAAQEAYFVLLKEYGLGLWEAMAKNKFNLYNSGAPMADAVASGEIGLAGLLSEALIYPKWKAGAPVHYTYSSPLIVASFSQLISKSAPHPNAAKLFQEFVHSRLGQTIMANDGLVSFRDDVKVERDVAKEPWFTAPGKPYVIDRKELAGSLAQMAKDYTRLFKAK